MSNTAYNPLISNQLYRSRKKSLVAAYLLWIFLSFLGAHRFYLNRPFSATIMLFLWVGAFAMDASTLFDPPPDEPKSIGIFVTYAAVFIWWIIDLFLIPSIRRRRNLEIALETGVTDPTIL